MGREVFISYSAGDKGVAEAVCAGLESASLRCWIAPRNITAGKDWDEAIIDGIDNSRAMVIIVSSHSNASDHVIREVKLAANKKWVGGRLPSEAEWEYAARSAGQERAYPWGNEEATCSRAVVNDGGPGCGRDATWPVCSKTAGNTAQGLCDMAGNLFEWVQDWKHDSYDGAPADGSAWETPRSSERVYRGGDWTNSGAPRARAAFRRESPQGHQTSFLGFRPARRNPGSRPEAR